MYRGIKVCLFKQSCQRLAVAACKKAADRAAENGKTMTEKEKLATIKQKVSVDLKGFVSTTFFPEFWLAFLMCSLPINDFISSRKLGLISLCPVAKQDIEAVPVSFIFYTYFMLLILLQGPTRKEGSTG